MHTKTVPPRPCATRQLELRSSGYYLRFWVVVDGKRVCKRVALKTRDRAMAESAAALIGTTEVRNA
jgi:hypothetical protein